MHSQAHRGDMASAARKGLLERQANEETGAWLKSVLPTEIRTSFYNPRGWDYTHTGEKEGKQDSV